MKEVRYIGGDVEVDVALPNNVMQVSDDMAKSLIETGNWELAAQDQDWVPGIVTVIGIIAVTLYYFFI